MNPPKVVFAILDAMPHRHVGADLTPTLWRLASEGGMAPEGASAVLSASTYPNHASFVTGALPPQHGIVTSKAWVDGEFRPAQEVGPQTETLFDACRDAGRRAVGLFGDPALFGVCGAAAADAHWPPEGVLPEDAPRGRLGYGADRAVVEAADSLAIETADLLVLQLDETDTARHLEGPDGEGALDQMQQTDAALGEIFERLAAVWDDSVVIAVSDHDHEECRRGAVDLAKEARERDLDLHIDHDGTSAYVIGQVDEATLLSLPCVTHTARLAEQHTLVWGEAGQLFGIDWGLAGHHGSPRTAHQLAVVGGGHAAAQKLARQIETRPPSAHEWAGWICDLLQIDWTP